jgi:outer membrane protein assembly factor BamB
MRQMPKALMIAVLVVTGVTITVHADDWPMWRCDSARTGQASQVLPDDMHLLWTRQLPILKPTYREPRLQFDAGYEPIVQGKTMFVALSNEDTVVAYDTETGESKWKYFAEGPIRLAPVAWKDRVFFGSDDGHLHCVNAATGKLLWKFQAVPSNRRILGSGRLISVWPVRGGPVVHDGRIYFAAGVFPFEGVFIYCLDAETAEVVWRNDESGYLYGQHPHDAKALGGVTPQGYLVVNGDELIVPCGQAVPARYELATGKLIAFEFPKPGRLPGGWFASADVRRGEVVLDAATNSDLHEDKTYQGPGEAGVRTTIRVGERSFAYGDDYPGVEGEIHTMLAADDKLFAVTLDGMIYAFGSERPSSVRSHAMADPSLPLQPAVCRGYLLVLGLDGDVQALFDTLLSEDGPDCHVIGFGTDAKIVTNLRQRSEVAGDWATRPALQVTSPDQLDLPPYMASVVYVLDASWLVALKDSQSPSSLFEVLRPFGGTAHLVLTDEQHHRFIAEGRFDDWLTVERKNGVTTVRREGGLAGAANYTGGWTSAEERVKAPLGLLWFDDTVSHFKRSPQPMFVDGLMISYPKDWMARHREGRKVPYDLLPPVLSDVYTGRVLSDREQSQLSPDLPSRDRGATQPNQYRPPYQTDDWNPKKPAPGERINPLTGEKEPRTFPKSYGCDGGVDYGALYTMRSGTAAFYDKRVESGTCHISGPRSGCTNSIIPACGLLNVPYFYEGCTCSYPLPCGLALVNMPEEYEQWATWGEGKAQNIKRVGINFGAPGDRMTRDGTLWLDYPSRGGPSPAIQVEVKPDTAKYFYHHSLWMSGGTGWPWVAASGVKGATSVNISGLRQGNFTVRLFFADPEFARSGDRLFDIVLNGRKHAVSYDVVKAAGGKMKSTTLEFKNIPVEGSLEISLTPQTGQPILSGIEIVLEEEKQIAD